MNTRSHSFGQNKQSWLDNFITQVRYKRIQKLIPPESRLLDLGCGYHGELLHALMSTIRHGLGIDLTTKQSSTKKIKLLSAPVDSVLPAKSTSFDIVTSLAVIEHLDHPEVMLSEAHRVLRPGGKLILTTPSLYGKPILDFLAWLGLISRTEIHDHKRYYLRSSLSHALSGAGFDPAKISVRPFGILWLNILGVAVK